MTSCEKEAVSEWRKTQKEQNLPGHNVRRIPALMVVMNAVLCPLTSATEWVIDTFRTEILKLTVLTFKLTHFFGDPSRKVGWTDTNPLEYHVPTLDNKTWSIVHVTKAGSAEVGEAQNVKTRTSPEYYELS